ncbi:hypothetical protein OHA88_03060 [Streptomyces sp. NBC_00353]
MPSPAHRDALEICAHAHTTTVDLLRAVLPGEDANTLFGWLRALPFTETGPHGIYPHDVVRDVLDSDLRWRAPEGYQAMHERIHAYLLQRSREASGSALLPAMAAMNHSHSFNGVLPGYMSGQRDHDVYEQPYRPQDRAALLHMAEEAEGGESAALVAYWLDRAPGDFHVHHRRTSGEPVGFMAWLRLTDPPEGRGEEEAAVDPVVAAAWRHVRAAGPVRAGEHIAIGRFMIRPPAYQRPSPSMDLIIQRILAEYLAPDQRAWSFNVHPDPEFLMTAAGHRAEMTIRFAIWDQITGAAAMPTAA